MNIYIYIYIERERERERERHIKEITISPFYNTYTFITLSFMCQILNSEHNFQMKLIHTYIYMCVCVCVCVTKCLYIFILNIVIEICNYNSFFNTVAYKCLEVNKIFVISWFDNIYLICHLDYLIIPYLILKAVITI